MVKRQSLVVQKEDRLSNLPDPIRNHIVSFLPFKDIVRTSILSRQWKDICSSLSNFDFEQIYINNRMSHIKELRDIVDQTIFVHDGSDVKRFNLVALVDGLHICPIHLNRWISFAVRHNVVELTLEVYIGQIQMLPCSFFTSTTLTTLRLSSFTLELPSLIRFPVLKTVELFVITFSGEHRSNRLFSDSCCPMLEKLAISCCNLDSFPTLSISVTNLKFIGVWDADHGLIISCPNLHEIHFEGTVLPEFSCETLSSLSIATLKFLVQHSNTDSMENRARNILTGMHNLNKLRLGGYYVQCLSTSFSILKYMYLSMYPTEAQLLAITCILRGSPNLQILRIYFYEDNLCQSNLLDIDGYWDFFELYTGGIWKQLRSVDIANFRGSVAELDLMRYLLESANILEEMNIACLDDGYGNKKRKYVIHELRMVTPLSPSARIKVS